MRKTLALMKRVIKWYMKQTEPYNVYAWCPSGMIPYNYSIRNKENK